MNSDGTTSFRAINGKYMVAEGGGGGTVNANRNAIGDWEKFHVVNVSPTPAAPAGPKNTVYLKVYKIISAPIYHTSVEIFGYEYAFWSNNKVKKMDGFCDFLG